MDKELRSLIRALREQGFEVEETSTGRHRVVRDGKFVAILASARTHARGDRNALAALRRGGFRDPKRKQR